MKVDVLFGTPSLRRRPGINSGSDSTKSVETDYLNNTLQWGYLTQTPICNRGRQRGDYIPIKPTIFINPERNKVHIPETRPAEYGIVIAKDTVLLTTIVAVPAMMGLAALLA